MPGPKSTSDPESDRSPEAAPVDPPAKKNDVTATKAGPVAKAAADNPERIPRIALSAGAVLLAIALALVGTGPSDIGRVLALAALLVLIYGVHSFGRLGPPDTAASPGGERS